MHVTLIQAPPTQKAIKLGSRFTYRFTVPDTSGTCFGALLRVGRFTQIHPGPAIIVQVRVMKEDEEMVAKKSRSGCMDDLSIALVMFEGAEEQDVVGPYEMLFWMSLFEALPPDRRPIGETDFAVDFIRESEFADYFYPKVAPKAKVFTVAPTINTYVMSSGMQWTPDFSYDNAPPANMIVAPGGRGAHDIPARHKDGTIDYIKRVANAPGSKYVMSVCTGAFLLGAAGLLDGRHCQVSSHNYDRFEREVPKARLVKDPSLSFVQDGNLFTSNGPCSGHATALRLVEVHCGTGYKNNLRELIEYIVPPVKGALVENGKVTTIVV